MHSQKLSLESPGPFIRLCNFALRILGEPVLDDLEVNGDCHNRFPPVSLCVNEPVLMSAIAHFDLLIIIIIYLAQRKSIKVL